MSRKTNAQTGFTITELMLAMAFLSFLLLFVLTATTQVMRAYNKGLTIKQMNQAGRTLVEDMSRTARNADGVTQANGRLCFGGASYIWNTPGTSTNKYNDAGNTPVDIVRINDSTGTYCADTSLLVDKSSVNTASFSNGQIRILSMSATPDNTGKLLNISFWLGSSSAGDEPNSVGPPGLPPYQCPTGAGSLFGSFCAVADFETVAYIRKANP